MKFNDMGKFFMDSLLIDINESSDSNLSDIQTSLSNIVSTMNINSELVEKFKEVIPTIIPVVNGLVENSNIEFESNTDNLTLLSLTILGISTLEETGNKAGHEVLECPSCGGDGCGECNNTGEKRSIMDKTEAQSLLEELRMRGIGNGIVKKMVSSFILIGEFSSNILKDTPHTINGLIDLLSSENVLKPMMNSISQFITEYKIDIEDLGNNLSSLTGSVNKYVSKKGVKWLLKRIEDTFGAKNVKLPDEGDGDILNSDTTEDQVDGNNLIKEQ
jgi:hypothetical protein